MNASQAVNGWLGDLTAPATAALPPPTGNGGLPAAAPVAPMSRTITRDDIAAALASAGGDHSYGGDYPQNYITSGGGQSANAPWTTPTAAPAYTGGVPFTPTATPPAASAEAIPASGIANAGPGLGSSQLTFTPHNPFAGAQAGASIAPAVQPAAGDPAPPPAVDSTGLSVDDTGYSDTGAGQPARVAARGAIGAVPYVKPQTVGQRVGGAALRVAGNAAAPGLGMLLGAIYNSAMRHGGTLDNARQYTGGPVTYNGDRAGVSPWGSAVYGAPYGATGYSNSMSTPTAAGWVAPSYNAVSGGPSYSYNPQTHTYIDSQGREHPYE
jgi:hypothetical protein